MTIDPVVRLAALHCDNAEDAIEILFPDGMPMLDNGEDAIEAAISALTEIIEDAICKGDGEVHLDLQVAELLALELKRHKRKRGHPRKSARERILRGATLQYAEDIAATLRKQGHGVEEARSLAAAEASVRAMKGGDYVGASTIKRQMKEAAAERRKTRKSRI
ncbi:MAG: hypothetical protein KKD64_03590 [Alphaproteobacteria bacterium]|nr:hypothetical protein [Alphaproteobacteria bacterium]MBU0794812.1 hypothetical protein [Alphaproteobacteria bacterium]MBU0876197.1 hypothetical protein [Alphaproteobacteria bacterium]MBU1768718.1 hypothetical protein [Alphaproteobacteria bacterium]